MNKNCYFPEERELVDNCVYTKVQIRALMLSLYSDIKLEQR